jgi:chemotaxis protein MotB
MAKKKRGGHGGHGWFVTFADLMALLMSFFVMVAAYSSQDKAKMAVVAGSFREAFGTQKENKLGGIVELNGIPTKPQLQNARLRPIEEASDFTAPTEFRRKTEGLTAVTFDRGFALAATSLRQALNDMPEISEISKNIIIEQTRDGLNLSLVDQDGRSMFPDGSVNPYERTRKVLEAVVPTIRRMPNRIVVSGHTSAQRPGQRTGWSAWELSIGRAGAVREILAGAGLPDDRFASVVGKADTDPMFPDNPYLAANRRVTITLLFEAPPIAPGARP